MWDELFTQRKTYTATPDDYVQAHAGDVAARNRVVEANLPLVVRFVKRYQTSSLTLDDLVQWGVFGLIRAAEQFDPARGYAFSTYAVRCIKNSVTHSALDGQIRIPAATLSAYRTARRRGKRGAPGVSRARRARVCGLVSRTGDLMPFPVTYGEAWDFTDRECLQWALQQLDVRSRRVLVARYWEHKELHVVGKELGLCKERVRQLQEQAEAQLRAYMEPAAG